MLKRKLRLTKNPQVISAIPLCFLYHCCQCVREILEQSVLLMDLHAQNTVQELPDVVVVCRHIYVRSGVMGCTLIDTFVFSIEKEPHLCQVLICQTCPPHLWGPHLLTHSGFLEKENAIITHNHGREMLNNNKLFNAIKAIPLKKSPLNSGGGETNGESNFTMDFITISKAFRPYCNQGRHESVTGKPSRCSKFLIYWLTLLSKLNLLRSLVSVARLSPWVRAPCQKLFITVIFNLP